MTKKYILILFTSMVLFNSCTDDDNNYDELIIGTWYQDGGNYHETTGQRYRSEMIFRNDGSYERGFFIMENNNPDEVIGYLDLSTGNYKIVDEELYLTNILDYGLDNENSYLDKNDLVLSGSVPGERSVTISLNDDKLTFHYSCPDVTQSISVSLCLGQQQFNRLQD